MSDDKVEIETTVEELYKKFYESRTEDERFSPARLENEPYIWYKHRIKGLERIVRQRKKGIPFHLSQTKANRDNNGKGVTYHKPKEELKD